MTIPELNLMTMQILSGGLLGVLGQGLRAVAGIKKANDAAHASGCSFSDVFEPQKLLVSLFIGFLAGAFALLGVGMAGQPTALDSHLITTVVAAGYAGTDFIDAFIARALPGAGSPGLPPADGQKPYG
jgi:hypothetical protein